MEVLRAYSNRPDLLEELRSLVAGLDEAASDAEANDKLSNAQQDGAHSYKRLSDRLSPEDIRAITVESIRLPKKVCQPALHIPEVRNEITVIMERGEKAFRLRKDKYGF